MPDEEAPKWASKLRDAPLEDLYDEYWSLTQGRGATHFGQGVAHFLNIRLTEEQVHASNELRQSVERLNEDSSRIAGKAIKVAIFALF